MSNDCSVWLESCIWFELVHAGHASCLKLSPAIIQTVKLTRWQCQDCKTCTVCKASRDSNKHRSAVCYRFLKFNFSLTG